MITREQFDRFVLLQDDREFRLTHDALELAHFATVHHGDRVCDLGCGVGNLLLPLAQRADRLILDGVEIRANAAALCRENLRINGLDGTVVCGDLNNRYAELPWGSYDLVLSNPPYFPAGSGARSEDPGRSTARTEDSYTLENACIAAQHLTGTGKRFALCLRPERMAEACALLRKHLLEPKRIQLLQPDIDRAPNLVLIEAVRQGRPGVQILPVRITI